MTQRPAPSVNLMRARDLLRERAVPDTAKRLRIQEDAVQLVADQGVEQMLSVLGEVDRAQAGWILLSCGMLLARNSAALEPQIEGKPAGEAFNNGSAWASLVTAVAGDSLVRSAAAAGVEAGAAPWAPHPEALEARNLAEGLVSGLLDMMASAASRERFATDAQTQLEDSLAELERTVAGWTLLTFGVWMASTDTVSALLVAGRGFRRAQGASSRKAMVGCSFVGALLAQVGLGLLPPDR